MIDDYDPYLEDPLLATIESILHDDIPDPNRRRAVAAMIHAHAKVSTVHSLREKFDPWLGIHAVKPTVEEALTAMRGAILRLAGYDRAGQPSVSKGYAQAVVEEYSGTVVDDDQALGQHQSRTGTSDV